MVKDESKALRTMPHFPFALLALLILCIVVPLFVMRTESQRPERRGRDRDRESSDEAPVAGGHELE